MLRLARYNSPCCIPGSMTSRSQPVGPSGLRPIHNVIKQRDGPKLFLPSMGVVEDIRGDKHDHSEKERQDRHGEFGRVHNCGPIIPSLETKRLYGLSSFGAVAKNHCDAAQLTDSQSSRSAAGRPADRDASRQDLPARTRKPCGKGPCIIPSGRPRRSRARLALRGTRRRSSPSIASTLKAQSCTSSSCLPECRASKSEIPSTPRMTAPRRRSRTGAGAPCGLPRRSTGSAFVRILDVLPRP
jgi:hypothetical protein